MPSVAKWTIVTCEYCGKERRIREAERAYQLRRNPNYRFFCDGVCAGRWRAEQPSLVKYATAVCANCGKSFQLKESVKRSRLLANGGVLYCGPLCASVGGRKAFLAAVKLANETGEMACSSCGKVRPLAEFRVKANAHVGAFKYYRVCVDCPAPTRSPYNSATRCDDIKERLETMLRTKYMRDEDIIDIGKCDHTPVAGPLPRAPDWRILDSKHAAEYKWSCCICGFMHKEYDDAKECCEPKGKYKGNKFVPFDKYRPHARGREEALAEADCPHPGAEGRGG